MNLDKSKALLERRKKYVSNGVGVFNTATVAKAGNAGITDLDGNEWIDFAGGIGVINAGHCPDLVVEAIARQASQYIHTSFNVVSYAPYVDLCQKLCELLAHGPNTKAMLVSTGAEAVENAIKIARQSTGRPGVLCFTDAFHGRTMMAMSLTSNVSYRQNCGPFCSDIYRIPFPNEFRYKGKMTRESFIDREIERLYEYGKTLFDPKNLAAIIIEPVQGEGGFNIVAEKYLQALRDYCNTYGILLILDEIQSGFGRTGAWASWQHYRVVPDLSTYAKSMGAGMPIAAVVGKTEHMDAAAPGTIGGTYIGNPVCCAAALANIKYMEGLNINRLGIELGEKILSRMMEWKSRFPQIGDVRGLGAMCAMEFVRDQDPGKADSATAAKIVKYCADHGLILLSAGTHKNVIRILSPLTIEDSLLQNGLDILEMALVDCSTSGR